MIVPVIVTAIILFPFLLYIIFPTTDLIPLSIDIYARPGGGGEHPADGGAVGETETETAANGAPTKPPADGEREQQPQPTVADDGGEPAQSQSQSQSPTPSQLESGSGGGGGEELDEEALERGKLSLAEVLDPFLDREGAIFGGLLMAVTLTTLLATNAAGKRPGVWTMTVPAGTIMCIRDFFWDWRRREKGRELSRRKRLAAEREKRSILEKDERKDKALDEKENGVIVDTDPEVDPEDPVKADADADADADEDEEDYGEKIPSRPSGASPRRAESGMAAYKSGSLVPVITETQIIQATMEDEELELERRSSPPPFPSPPILSKHSRSHSNETNDAVSSPVELLPKDQPASAIASQVPVQMAGSKSSSPEKSDEQRTPGAVSSSSSSSPEPLPTRSSSALKRPSPTRLRPKPRRTLSYYINEFYWWMSGTFPTVCAVFSHLPFALLPFAFSMFILVQGLVTKGWVQLFADGWAVWVQRTGFIGAIGGMGFLSVCLCNVRLSLFCLFHITLPPAPFFGFRCVSLIDRECLY
jgi:hypothetical protein